MLNQAEKEFIRAWVMSAGTDWYDTLISYVPQGAQMTYYNNAVRDMDALSDDGYFDYQPKPDEDDMTGFIRPTQKALKEAFDAEPE